MTRIKTPPVIYWLLRAAVWREYQPGQEKRKVRPSKAYFRVARAAIKAAQEACPEVGQEIGTDVPKAA